MAKIIKNENVVVVCGLCGKKYKWSGYHQCISCRVKISLMSGNVIHVRQKSKTCQETC